MNKEKVVEQIIQHHKNLGFDVDGKGYLKSSEDNLIELFPNWDEIKNELNNGTGGELKSDENDRVKFWRFIYLRHCV